MSICFDAKDELEQPCEKGKIVRKGITIFYIPFSF